MKLFLLVLFITLCFWKGVGAQTGFYFITPDHSSEITITSFEEQTFFFRPGRITPSAPGIFEEVYRLLPEHPLNSVSDNPARLAAAFDGRIYLYADTRTLQREKTFVTPFNSYPCVNCLSYVSHTFERTISEPQVSFSLFFRPDRESRFAAGLVWQMLRINQNYYGTMLTPASTYNSYTTATGTPYSADRFHQSAYLPSLLVSWKISPHAAAGLQLGFAHYRADGALKSDPDFKTPSISPLRYFNRYSVHRTQDYSHIDLTGGIEFNLSDRLHTGFSLGYLYGTASQTEFHSSVGNSSDLASITTGDPFMFILSEWLHDTVWNREGYTLHSSAAASFKVNDRQAFRLWLNSSVTRRDLSSQNRYFGFSSRSTGFQHSPGEEQYNLHYNEILNLSNGLGHLNEMKFMAGVQVHRSVSRVLELTAGLQARADFTEARSYENDDRSTLTRYRSESNSELTETGESESRIGYLQTFSIDRRGLTLYAPIVFKAHISSLFSAEAAVMPSFHRLSRNIGSESVPDNHPGFTHQDSPTSFDHEMSDQLLRVNTYLALQLNTGGPVSFRIMGMPNHRKPLSSDFSLEQTRNFRFMFSLELNLE